MDFKRIERIFIVVFFALNVFLLYTYAVGNAEKRDDVEKNISDNIEEELRSEDIEVEGKLSTKVNKGYYLSAIATNWSTLPEVSENKLLTIYDQSQNLSGHIQESEQPTLNLKNIKRETLEVVSNSDLIPFGKDYSFFGSGTDANQQFLMYQMYEELPIIDDTAKLTLFTSDTKNSIKITNYTMTHVDSIAPLREKQDMITEKDAIITLFVNNKFPSKTKITSTQLAYVNIYTVNGKFVYVPAWLVTIETSNGNSQIERVNAFTNSIISSGKSEVE